MASNQWDVVVIGGGAAGLSAALLLGRSRRRTLVVDEGSPRNRFAAHVHGALASEGTTPGDLLQRGRAEASGYGVQFVTGAVQRVDEAESGVEVTLREGEPLLARAVVVASGLSDELPDIPGLADLWGTSVVHCPYCHGWEVADQRLGVLATSPMGVHKAQLVRQWSADVTVFTAGLGALDMATEFRLRARGLRLVASPVAEVIGQAGRLAAVCLQDGGLVELDALFVAPTPRPHDAFLQHQGLARAETPMGSFLAVDATGRTSSDRIWAVGNVTNPAANVPMSVGAGAATGGAVNQFLVAEDFDRAAADRSGWPEIAPADYWEHRYAGPDRVWSGRVNQVLADVSSSLNPGRALDLGCGEGADAIWLAQQGWTVTGIDISPSAIRRAAEAARAMGIPEDRITFAPGDLATLDEQGEYDLVTASFLHSPVDLPRTEILRAAAGHVTPGGHLLITSHASAPPWAHLPEALEPRFPTPAEDVDALGLDPGEWTVQIAQTRPRVTTDPHGNHASIDDSVVLIQRR